MRVLIAPNPYKHCLSAKRVAQHLGRGFRASGWQVDLLPLADGGPGTLDALQTALGGERHVARVHDALGRPCRAAWLKVGRLAVIESAEAIGLEKLGRRRDALRASSEGLGELLLAAQKAGCREAWVGLGGSATTDGGTGMARAIGWSFFDAKGKDLAPGGAALRALHQVRKPAKPLLRMRIRALHDVKNPMTGPQGSAKVFAPQKGASPAQVRTLGLGLQRLATLLGASRAKRQGAGAAGGLGFGLSLFTGSRLQSGAWALLCLTGFRERLAKADLVVTGEGRLDAQTLGGKLPARILATAKRAGKPSALVVGHRLGGLAPWQRLGALAIVDLSAAAGSVARAMREAPQRLEAAGRLLGSL